MQTASGWILLTRQKVCAGYVWQKLMLCMHSSMPCRQRPRLREPRTIEQRGKRGSGTHDIPLLYHLSRLCPRHVMLGFCLLTVFIPNQALVRRIPLTPIYLQRVFSKISQSEHFITHWVCWPPMSCPWAPLLHHLIAALSFPVIPVLAPLPSLLPCLLRMLIVLLLLPLPLMLLLTFLLPLLLSFLLSVLLTFLLPLVGLLVPLLPVLLLLLIFLLTVLLTFLLPLVGLLVPLLPLLLLLTFRLTVLLTFLLALLLPLLPGVLVPLLPFPLILILSLPLFFPLLIRPVSPLVSQRALLFPRLPLPLPLIHVLIPRQPLLSFSSLLVHLVPLLPLPPPSFVQQQNLCYLFPLTPHPLPPRLPNQLLPLQISQKIASPTLSKERGRWMKTKSCQRRIETPANAKEKRVTL